MPTELIIIYVTDESAIVYLANKQPKSIIFPKKIIDGQNVLDKEAFFNLLADQLFMIENKESVIVIGSGILFQHAVPKDVKEDINEFYASLPFGQNSIVKKEIETDTKKYYLATNKDYIDTFIMVAENFKAAISAAIPLSLFTDKVDRKELSDDLLTEIRNNTNLFHAGDFLQEMDGKSKPVQSYVEEKNENMSEPISMKNSSPVSLKSGWSKGGILFFFFLVLLSVAVAVGGYFFLSNMNTQSSSSATPTPTVPAATPTPTPVEKEDLTVEVLNGTGTPGQAGKIKAIIEDLEYSEVETGNADIEDAEDTSVTFSSRVSKTQQEEVINALEEVFETITPKIIDDQEKDIVIITGIEK